MSEAIVGAICSLIGILLGYWVGFDLGRAREYERQWAEMCHPAGKGRDD